jgi:hypothetical protein
MSFASNNVGYDVVINGQTWSWTEFESPNDCSYSVVYTAGITTTINIKVTISDAASGRRALSGSLEERDGPWFLDVNDFV